MNREELKKYRYNQQWIEGRMEYIQQYKETINKLTATLSDMPMGSRTVQDSEAEKIVKFQEMIDKLLDKILEENLKQEKILEQLDRIEQPYKLLLEKVYIQGKTLVTVASEMNYNYDHMRHMNGIALLKFDQINQCDTKSHCKTP